MRQPVATRDDLDLLDSTDGLVDRNVKALRCFDETRDIFEDGALKSFFFGMVKSLRY